MLNSYVHLLCRFQALCLGNNNNIYDSATICQRKKKTLFIIYATDNGDLTDNGLDFKLGATAR